MENEKEVKCRLCMHFSLYVITEWCTVCENLETRKNMPFMKKDDKKNID